VWRSCSGHTENTANNSSSIDASVRLAAIMWRLLSHCLATGLIAEPFPSNGCLFLLHNSGFRQTSHIIIIIVITFLGKTHFLSKDFVYIELVEYYLRVLHIVASFVTGNLQTIVQTECVDAFRVYLPTNFTCLAHASHHSPQLNRKSHREFM
jgi:hypothetical protein